MKDIIAATVAPTYYGLLETMISIKVTVGLHDIIDHNSVSELYKNAKRLAFRTEN